MLFWSKLIGGIVLVLVGVFWMLQGLNVIQGYLMSGQTTFFVVGVVVALVGAWLLWSVEAHQRCWSLRFPLRSLPERRYKRM